MDSNYSEETLQGEVLGGDDGNKPGKGLSIAGMVLGILSIILCACNAGFLAIPGLICSIIGNKKSKNGLAIAGIVTSIIGLLIFIVQMVMLVMILVAGDSAASSFMDYSSFY